MSDTQKMKVKLFLLAQKMGWDNDFKVEVYSSDYDGGGVGTSVKLGSVEVEIDVPKIDRKSLTLLEIEQLQERIKQEKTESNFKIQALNERIQNLQCLEAPYHA